MTCRFVFSEFFQLDRVHGIKGIVVNEQLDAERCRCIERNAYLLTTVDKQLTISSMSTNTMSFALPESLREYIDERVRSGQYGNTSEYLRDLIRRDKADQAKQRLRELITEGLASGPARPLSPNAIADLREKAFGPIS